VALAFVGGASASAMAKPAKVAKPAGGVHTTVKPPAVMAHATGHKIA
jgi:hypothetical protein